uniref:Uncharacterized protein n=1 Tax=Arundo donax TaxID=35708 RepID=A0A0A8XSM9_ARUDO
MLLYLKSQCSVLEGILFEDVTWNIFGGRL